LRKSIICNRLAFYF